MLLKTFLEMILEDLSLMHLELERPERTQLLHPNNQVLRWAALEEA
jgi:hypothetical protein